MVDHPLGPAAHMKNAPDDYAADAQRLKERLDWLQLTRNAGKISLNDFDAFAHEVTRFVARWGDHFRNAEPGRSLQDFAVALRRAVVANEIVHRNDVLQALASRRDLLSAENLLSLTREMYRALETMPPDERKNAEALLGPREDTLGHRYRAVEEAETQLKAQLNKMRAAWPDCANGDFARRVNAANDTLLVAWMADVSAEIERLSASPAHPATPLNGRRDS